jgi:hypothetical protein
VRRPLRPLLYGTKRYQRVLIGAALVALGLYLGLRMLIVPGAFILIATASAALRSSRTVLATDDVVEPRQGAS